MHNHQVTNYMNKRTKIYETQKTLLNQPRVSLLCTDRQQTRRTPRQQMWVSQRKVKTERGGLLYGFFCGELICVFLTSSNCWERLRLLPTPPMTTPSFTVVAADNFRRRQGRERMAKMEGEDKGVKGPFSLGPLSNREEENGLKEG